MGLARWTMLGIVAATTGAATARAEAPGKFAGIPITDPSFAPTLTGVGHEPDVYPALDSPTILFVNFDATMINACGNNDPRGDCSTIGFVTGPFIPYDGSPSDRAAIIQATREDLEDFGVIVVAERPPEGQPYAMVAVGTPGSGGTGSIGGIAPAIDCGNVNPYITSFAFLVDAGPNTLATVINQEAAHTWGLEHVDASSDNLYPSAGGTVDPGYTDECHQIVDDTNLNPTGFAQCNPIHTLFCAQNQQNSYQEMLALFGPPIPDLVAPTIQILAPGEGEELDYASNFDLTFVLDDDRRPQILDIVIYVDDVEITDAVLIDQEHTFPVTGGDPPGHGLPNGTHTIRIEAFDEGGNPASDEVSFVIVNGPEAPAADDTGSGAATAGPSDGDGDGDTAGDSSVGADGGGRGGDDGGCGCRSPGPAPLGLATFLLVALGVRRRR